MSRQKVAEAKLIKTNEFTKAWALLTWDELENWAGSRSVSRGQAYQRQGHVRDLALADDGRLLATVHGGERYVTSAWLTSGKAKRKQVESICTCPVGASGCKHAVAVVADFLVAIADKRQVPAAKPDDRRWAKLSEDSRDASDDFDEDEDEDDEEEDEDDEDDDVRSAKKGSPRKKAVTTKRRSRAEWDAMIQTHIGQKSREDLAQLVGTLIERFPELRQEFQERIALGEGDVDPLLAAARRELRAVTAEPAWRNHWNDEGHTPDYRRLKHKLERLVELGHSDRVVELGRELIARGMEQVGQSNDEGETATELSDCLTVVFAALAKSSLAPPDKILCAIDACLEDQYDVIGDSVGKLLDGKWGEDDWSLVADRLAKRLEKTPRGKDQDEFSRNYHRDCVTNYLTDALARAGRGAELLAIYEAEARATGSYQRLVSYLVERKQFDDAERWAREGIDKTQAKWPGIASGLAESMCAVAKRRKQWDVVAAHAADEFFKHPGTQAFKTLVSAAKVAGCEEQVRATAQQFLESGASPLRVATGGKGRDTITVDPSWPLPVPDYLLPLMSNPRGRSAPGPHYDVLLDMAIINKRPADVWRWHEKIAVAKKQTGRGYGHLHVDSDRVAKAIATAYPERALEIYQRDLNARLPQTGIAAYETCAACLRKMRPIFKSLDREDHWDELLADIRHNYRNRPRFMELLDRLDGRPIVQSQKASRRR